MIVIVIDIAVNIIIIIFITTNGGPTSLSSTSLSSHRWQKTVSWHSWWVNSYNPRDSGTSPHPIEYALTLTSITLCSMYTRASELIKGQNQNSERILICMVKMCVHELSENICIYLDTWLIYDADDDDNELFNWVIDARVWLIREWILTAAFKLNHMNGILSDENESKGKY